MSIGDLAEATGVAPGTLRMWEQRHGFPRATRQAGGHRRYSGEEAQRVLRVLRDRDRGLSLVAAIDRALSWTPGEPPSLFSAMRERQPDLESRRIPFDGMLAISRAIEDECFARAARPVLLGSFQSQAAFAASAPRWNELARTACATVVLGEFDEDVVANHAGDEGLVALAVAEDSPVLREWAVVCVDDQYCACLTAWEQPLTRSGARVFEAAWTTTPTVAAATVEAGLRLAERGAYTLPDAAREALARANATAEPDARSTLAVANRMVGYLAAGER